MGLLDGKTAVITGSSRGLGLAIAEAYAREGAAVVVASRAPASVAAVVERLKAQGARAAGLACDVADLEQVRALADFAVRAFGGFDVWVNNAGMAGPYGPTYAIPPERFTRVLQTNIHGTYHGSLVAMQYFVKNHAGKLINILGRGDDGPVPMQNAYTSTKAWVRAFTQALAKESQGTGVSVLAYNPGLMYTEFMSNVEAIQGYEARLKPLVNVMRLWANPPEVPARKAVWLASSATDGKTGLVVRELTPLALAGGILRAGLRSLLRRPAREFTLCVETLPSDVKDEG